MLWWLLVKLVERFLGGIAEAWEGGLVPTLRIIGSTALMLQTPHTRQTKDSDILETADLGLETQARLLQIGGPGTALARRWKIYVDVVPNGLPFLPLGPCWRDVLVPEAPPTIRFQALDVTHVGAGGAAVGSHCLKIRPPDRIFSGPLRRSRSEATPEVRPVAVFAGESEV